MDLRYTAVEHMLATSSAQPTPLKPLDLFDVNGYSIYYCFCACVFANQTQAASIMPCIPLLCAWRKTDMMEEEIGGDGWESRGGGQGENREKVSDLL